MGVDGHQEPCIACVCCLSEAEKRCSKCEDTWVGKNPLRLFCAIRCDSCDFPAEKLKRTLVVRALAVPSRSTAAKQRGHPRASFCLRHKRGTVQGVSSAGYL